MGKSGRRAKVHDLSETGTEKNNKRKQRPREGVEAHEENIHSPSREHKRSKKKNAHPDSRFIKEDKHSTKSQNHTGEQYVEPVKNNQIAPTCPTSILRKKVNPELANYFYQISNLFESNGIDPEERPSVCGSALEETRGEELALATDVVLSRTLQVLLEGCGFDALCGFLVSTASVFSHLATDKSGSHVAETALKSLISHLEDPDNLSEIESILRKICEAIVLDSATVMSSPYGSHVLRSLVCLCKGVSVDSLEDYHITKRSSALAERLNFMHSKSKGKIADPNQHGFPDIFKFLVFEMLRQAKDEISGLCANKYGSFVLQTVLKLLHGDEEGLLHVILLILGCPDDRAASDLQISTDVAVGIGEMLEDTASSHLLEVIIELAPDNLYDEILRKVFKGSFAKISMHHCGNFVVQALLSSVKSSAQLESMWEELHPLMKELLETDKSGVIACLLAACHRLQTRGRECCHALANAVCSGQDFPSAIIPCLLFRERLASGEDYSSWEQPSREERMHVMGSLMLQIVFRFPKKLIQPYTRSILSMDADQMAKTARDPGGARVLEAFFSSDSSLQQKAKVIGKLQGCFGELSLNASSSFVVEKCFEAADLPLKSCIASELVTVKSELLKKKHGAYIIKKLDIDGLESRPEQWSRRQAYREQTYREFQAAFGSDGNKRQGPNFLSSSTKDSRQKGTEPENGNKRQGLDFLSSSAKNTKNRNMRQAPVFPSSTKNSGHRGNESENGNRKKKMKNISSIAKLGVPEVYNEDRKRKGPAGPVGSADKKIPFLRRQKH